MDLVALMPFPLMVFAAGCLIGLGALITFLVVRIFWPDDFKD